MTKPLFPSRLWFSQSASWPENQSGNLAYGNRGLENFIHEIGHSLGLSHPGSYNAAPGTTLTYAKNAEYSQDTQQWSVMSYFDPGDDGTAIDRTRHHDVNGDMGSATRPTSPRRSYTTFLPSRPNTVRTTRRAPAIRCTAFTRPPIAVPSTSTCNPEPRHRNLGRGRQRLARLLRFQPEPAHRSARRRPLRRRRAHAERRHRLWRGHRECDRRLGQRFHHRER